MKLKILRQWFTDVSTCGELFIDDVRECFTLELPIVDGLPGSAIPPGTYPITVLWSPKFERDMPHVIDIPNRSNIEIHWGNTAADTDGCILLGRTHLTDFIGESRMAWEAFWAKAQQAALGKDCFIEVIGGAP